MRSLPKVQCACCDRTAAARPQALFFPKISEIGAESGEKCAFLVSAATNQRL